MTSFIPGLINPHARPNYPLLKAAALPYAPKRWHDARSACLEPSHQGSSSRCVLETLCGLAEVRTWKLDGVKRQLDSVPAYARAKQLDGMPNAEGTTLEAGLQAMIDVGYLSEVKLESLRTIYSLPELKRALHRYDVVACAWYATTNWLTPDRDGWIKPGGDILGGHATLACYFDEDERSIGWQDSYGAERGDQGFCRMHESAFEREFSYGLVFDFL